MDKFGIFKLLNSFLNKNGQNDAKKNDSSSAFSDAVSGLFSSLSSNKPTPQIEKKGKPAIKHPPLQSSMLSTLTNHDAFIKRVKERNQIKSP